jgi:hypothetical protein
MKRTDGSTASNELKDSRRIVNRAPSTNHPRGGAVEWNRSFKMARPVLVADLQQVRAEQTPQATTYVVRIIVGVMKIKSSCFETLSDLFLNSHPRTGIRER